MTALLFGACLQRLVEPSMGERDDASDLALLATRTGIHLFPYIERDLPDIAFEPNGEDDRLDRIGTSILSEPGGLSANG